MIVTTNTELFLSNRVTIYIKKMSVNINNIKFHKFFRVASLYRKMAVLH